MVRNFLLMALPLMLILGTMAGCEGPAGSEGPQGSQGGQGAVGPAGEDGSVMHAGKGAPKKEMGANGDYYLNRNSGELYGPKNDKGWGTPISLKGPSGEDGQDGKNGEDGSQIHSGTGAPAPSLGANGDYYLNKANFDLYGPKSPKKKNNWGTPINLKGTANVMYSSWVTPIKWEKDVIYGDRVRYFDIAANAITQDVLDKAVVIVYADFIGGASIYQLPIVPPGDRLRFYFELTFQNLRIGYLDPDNSGTDPGAISLGNKFRYVIIPGGVAAKSKLSTEQIKDMSYQEVKQRFGIRD